MAYILVVDDEPGIVKLLEALLEDAGHQVVGVQNAQDAFDVLDSDAVDLILLDLMMPQMSGWDFLDRLDGRPTAAPPVTIVSAVFQEKAIQRAREKYNTSGYVTKPFRVEELLDTIDHALGIEG